MTHTYPYSQTTSTFIVECEAATWQRAGFASMSENAQWLLRLDGANGAAAIHQTPGLRARLLWTSAVNLGVGGRLADAPADFRQLFAAADQIA